MTIDRYHYEANENTNQPSTDTWIAVLEPIADLANKISGTDFVPDSYRGKPAQVAAAILHGRELGLPPLTALAITHVIQGKPAISAEAMRSLVLQAGHDITFQETTSARCIIRGRRQGQEDWTTVEWTLEDARQAELTRNPSYKKYPRQMLIARASAELCRILFADVIHGMRAVEEFDETEINPPNGTTPARAEPQATVRRKPTAKQLGTVIAAAGDPEGSAPPETPPPPRKRATIQRRTTTQPAPPEEPAETVEEPPRAAHTRLGPRAEPEPEPEPEPNLEPADKDQITAIQMHTQRLGIDKDEREFRHTVVAALAGLVRLESTNDLTHHQATLVLNQLGKLKDREALEDHLNQLPPF